MKHFRLLILSLGLALVCLAAAARQVIVSGVVTDASGSALVGATVLVQGGSQGVTTDNKGQFTLNVPEGTVLDISFVGYEKQSVPVKAGAPMHITLQEEATQMGEVVVVGYGVQKKVNLTGAVSQISGDAIADKAAPNVLASLQGELPGVVVTQSSGQPGEEGFALQIRGHSSVNTISTLVLIDGIEGDLDMLNPNDIESISVLKDAASASIYGSKAAAGVILVTTKQGAAERVKVSYNGSYSFTRQGRKPSRINSWEEYEITQRANNKAVNAEMIEWLKNPNFNSMLSSSTALSYLDNTDWIRKSLNDWSHMQRHSLSVRGGSNKLNYMASVGYYERRGFFKYGPDDNNRFNFRANLFSRINRYLDLSIKLTADRSEINANAFNASKVLAEVYRCRTRMPVYFPQDEDPLVNPNLYAGQDGTNPIDLMKNAGTSDNINNDVSGQANLRIRNLVKGLQINLTASRKYRANLNDRKTRRLIWYSRGDNEYRYSQTTPNGVQKRRDNSFTDNLRAVADYDLKLGRSHNFHIMAGTEWENYRFDRVYATKDYMPDGFYSLNFGNSQSAFNSDLINTSAVMSFFGRFNYNFREKYLFEVNLRYDGSSRLAPANRWELFPSVSGGWVISKENFFRDKVKFIDLLKVRASW
ncbi:SusC/RagA family TonB-linked outer membrane protein, partial [Alistipes finegoldii]